MSTNAGTLAFGQATLPTNAIVTVTNGAVLSLNFTGTNQVAGLVMAAASQSPGIYNAANGSSYIAGTGNLLIGIPVATNSTDISYTFGRTHLTLSWPADNTGWRLETQTNPLTTGLGTNRMTILGSTGTNQFTIPLGVTTGSVFFRLAYP